MKCTNRRTFCDSTARHVTLRDGLPGHPGHVVGHDWGSSDVTSQTARSQPERGAIGAQKKPGADGDRPLIHDEITLL
jgi:hypothetical protein